MKGFLHPGAVVGHLVLIADNCAGQNKNKTMIKFIQWLVEAGFVKQATLLFLIKGHTKNICDRFYNLVKTTYHNKNIYSEKYLDNVLGIQDNITIHRMVPANFKNFDNWLFQFYTELDSISTFHEFTFGASEDNLTTTGCKVYSDAPKTSFELLPSRRTSRVSKNYSVDERRAKILTMYEDLETIENKGLSEQKQCEMYFKWRPMIPEEYREELCPRPSDEAIERHRKYKEDKRQMRNNIERNRMEALRAGQVADNLEILEDDV